MATVPNVTEKQGDLFTSDASLAHCISADLSMGKGIATLFKNKFGKVDKLAEQHVTPGGCAYLKDGNRYIFYLVTKDHYWNKPTYETLKNSLIACKNLCVYLKMTRLAMPRIGAGLDRLEWPKVLDIIHQVFDKTAIQVTIYSL